MGFKQFNLFIIGIVVVVLFFEMPVNNKWLTEKILCENCGIYKQSHFLGVDQRMSIRFGGPYDAFKAIEKMIRDSKGPNPVLLLPPNKYLHMMKIEGNIDMPEPAVFYYFTGIRSVMASSPDKDQANWALVAKDNRIWLKPVPNKQYRDSLLTLYKKYLD